MRLTSKQKCEHCKEPIEIRNPTGYCDHLHYPENCQVCEQAETIKTLEAKVAELEKTGRMNNEQQAFPIFTHEQVHIGMTLRDYFAAKAMQGLIANDFKSCSVDVPISARAYELADAMLEEREDKP